jgi:sugar lactone lactonase YvrE
MTLFLLAACNGVSLDVDPEDTDLVVDDTGSDDTGDTEVEDTGDPIVYDCSNLPELPTQFTLLEGFTGAEDFAFDGEGNLVSVDQYGNLVGISYEGDKEVISPGFGTTAGTHYTSEGHLAIADVDRGRIVLVDPEGNSDTLISGLLYPNGVTVDNEDWVYFAEHDAGQVRRVHPETGEDETLATGLMNPNGLAFSTDWQTLYVGSFGGGTVHAIDRDGDGWSTRLFAEVETDVTDPCIELSEGSSCFIPITGGLGVCDDAVCEADRDRAACDALDEGDICTTMRLETEVESLCAVDDEGLYCPRLEKQRVASCDGKQKWASCQIGQAWGYCVDTWEEVMACITDNEQWTHMKQPCADLAIGDACVSQMPTGPYEGTCEDYSDWGYGVICENPFMWGETGGLDGLNVDACDNVYVTEYVLGNIYRFDSDGGNQQVVAETGSFWIPNMHWGSGIGGWKKDVLYVMDRESFGVFALEIGVPGGPLAYTP